MHWSALFPYTAVVYAGPAVPYWLLLLVALVGTARSLVHLFAPDGGAHSIAGLELSRDSSGGLVAIFGQWGASQLVFALVIWVVVVFYRGLTPLAWLLVAIESALRLLSGRLKPVNAARRPPGAIGTWVMLPLAVVMLAWALL